MNNRGFMSAVGLRKISIGPRNRIRPTYVSTKLNPKCNLELIDLLKEVLFSDAWPRLIDHLTVGLKNSGTTYQ